MIPRQEPDYGHAGSPLSATNRNSTAFWISSTVTIVASALGWVVVISKMQIYTIRYHVDNVGLAPFAAATKHFPDLAAFPASKWQVVFRTTPHAIKSCLIHPIQ